MSRAILTALIAAIILIAAAPAAASLGSDVRQGRVLAARVGAGGTTCAQLGAADLEHIGESVMDRAIGSRAGHAAINARMAAVMGAGAAERMHQALGRRFAGC